MSSPRLLHPTTLRQALAAFAGNAAWLAGGEALWPAIKAGEQNFDTLIDLSAIAELREIHHVEDRLIIGAMARHRHLADHPLIGRHAHGLARLAACDRPDQSDNGSIGGALALNEEAAGYPLALLALEAVIETSHGVHDAGDFLGQPGATPLADGELILRVNLCIPKASTCVQGVDGTALFIACHAEGHQVWLSRGAGMAQRWKTAETALDTGQPPASVTDSALGKLLAEAITDLR